MSDKSKLGRPTGPSGGKVARSWDPTHFKPGVLQALLYVLANPDKKRCEIADHIGISGSKLSIITCSELGRNYLQSHKNMPEQHLIGYKI